MTIGLGRCSAAAALLLLKLILERFNFFGLFGNRFLEFPQDGRFGFGVTTIHGGYSNVIALLSKSSNVSRQSNDKDYDKKGPTNRNPLPNVR